MYIIPGTYVLHTIKDRSVTLVEGVAKIIDELGLMIIQKDVELELKQKEIDSLRRKIEAIEHYINMYEENCNYDFALKK